MARFVKSEAMVAILDGEVIGCAVCGAGPSDQCIPECDADELPADQVTYLAIQRAIDRFKP